MLKKLLIMILFVVCIQILFEIFLISNINSQNDLFIYFLRGIILVVSIFVGNVLIFKYKLKKR